MALTILLVGCKKVASIDAIRAVTDLIGELGSAWPALGVRMNVFYRKGGMPASWKCDCDELQSGGVWQLGAAEAVLVDLALLS
jgi:hypothetical protein